MAFAVTDAVDLSVRTSASVQVKDEEHIMDLCKKCFRRKKATRPRPIKKQHQQQGRTRGAMEISRGLHGLTFEVIKTFTARKGEGEEVVGEGSEGTRTRRKGGW